MLWVKALHIIGVVVWFAGLFYLLRLYVYHAMESERIVIERFKVMERRLYLYITVPGAYVTVLTGMGLLWGGWDLFKIQGWLHLKILLVLLLLGIHLYSGHLRKKLLQGEVLYSHVYFRYLNEIPTLLLILIVILVVVKPF